MGSIALSDTTQGLNARYTYEPYGKTQVEGNPGDNAFAYTGREEDGAGLYYYRARYYHSEISRFVSEDPIGLNGGNNLYAYVDGNPVSRTDPEGLFWGPSAKCAVTINEFETALKSCRGEWDSCGNNDRKRIEFIENNGGNFISTAIYNCAVQKAPVAYKNMIRECGSSAVSPKGPWPLKK